MPGLALPIATLSDSHSKLVDFVRFELRTFFFAEPLETLLNLVVEGDLWGRSFLAVGRFFQPSDQIFRSRWRYKKFSRCDHRSVKRQQVYRSVQTMKRGRKGMVRWVDCRGFSSLMRDDRNCFRARAIGRLEGDGAAPFTLRPKDNLGLGPGGQFSNGVKPHNQSIIIPLRFLLGDCVQSIHGL